MSSNGQYTGSVLVVEDEPAQRQLMTDILTDLGLTVTQAASQAAALAAGQAEAPQLIISDWKLESGDGLSLLRELRDSGVDSSFIMVTAYGSIAHAMEAIRAGADDYLSKPFERQALLLAVERTLRARNLQAENQRLAEEVGERGAGAAGRIARRRGCHGRPIPHLVRSGGHQASSPHRASEDTGRFCGFRA